MVAEAQGGGPREQLAVGDGVTLAARLQRAAPANGVVISGSAHGNDRLTSVDRSADTLVVTIEPPEGLFELFEEE